jgi:hypothetical protein
MKAKTSIHPFPTRRVELESVVQGDLEKLTEHWSMGWRRVTFYGDLQPHVKELCG